MIDTTRKVFLHHLPAQQVFEFLWRAQGRHKQQQQQQQQSVLSKNDARQGQCMHFLKRSGKLLFASFILVFARLGGLYVNPAVYPRICTIWPCQPNERNLNFKVANLSVFDMWHCVAGITVGENAGRLRFSKRQKNYATPSSFFAYSHIIKACISMSDWIEALQCTFTVCACSSVNTK